MSDQTARPEIPGSAVDPQWSGTNYSPEPPPTPTEEMILWWERRATVEAQRTVPKAIEYGATDLLEVGRKLVAAGVRKPMGEPGSLTTPQLIELGIYFYIVGKMARWADAVARGELVSDDTLFDIGVYVRMIQRVRETGGWPG